MISGTQGGLRLRMKRRSYTMWVEGCQASVRAPAEADVGLASVPVLAFAGLPARAN
jgi:hypothetical protein